MILIIDDDSAIRTSLSLLLKHAGYEVKAVSMPKEAMEVVRNHTPRLILMDMNFSLSTDGVEGLTLLKQVKLFLPEVPVILMTAWGSIELAVQGMQAGAFDFITKPWQNILLMQRIETALKLTEKKEEEATVEENGFDRSGIIGKSKALTEILKTVQRIAPTTAPVLIMGESGTGKELYAQAIHNASVRSRQPFVAVNCGAIPRSLLQSELFGYVEGSFTGAARKGHPGKFELADGGTIFLDEISELPFEAQTALLRLIQTREVERIGASQLRRVNVRIIAATNKDLGAEVLRGGFRHDLLYRINALTITIPPLRQRRGDIPLLVESFLRKKAVGGLSRRFSVAAMKRLYEWKWPGNVRELENVIECAAAICGEEEISLEQLDFILNRGSINDDMPDPVSPEEKSTGEERTLSELERASLEEVLAETEGNVKKTSEILGVSRKTVYNKIHKYQIRTSEYRKRS